MPDKKNLILIPTDFSEACDNAIDHGVEIAKAYSAEICILHVINKDTKTYLQKNKLTHEDLDRRLEVISKSISKNHKVKINVIIRIGSIFNEINKVASEISAGMIVLGTHGKTGFQRIFGSFIMRIILHAPVPTIVVQKRAFGHGYKNVVFPVNESIEYKQKLEWTKKLQFAFQSKIHIFKFKESNKELSEYICKVTDNIKHELLDKGINFAEAEAKNESNFSKQLLDYSVSNSADLIMIMTNNDEFEPSFILGYEEEKVIYNASQIPILCINPSH
jgi:nucleotide-binding universal stress UspA family protein